MNSRKTNLFAVFAAILMVAVPLAVVGDSADMADAAENDVETSITWTNNVYHYVNSGISKNTKIQNGENVEGLTALSLEAMGDANLKIKCNASGAWAVSDNGWTTFDGSKWSSVTLLNSRTTLFSINDGVTLTLKDIILWRCEATVPILMASNSDGTGSVTIEGDVAIGNPEDCEGYTIIDVDTLNIYGDAEIYGTINANVVLHDGATLRGDAHIEGNIAVADGADATFGTGVTTSGKFTTGYTSGYEVVGGFIRIASTTTTEYNNLSTKYDEACEKIKTLETEKNNLAAEILSKKNNITQLQEKIDALENVEKELDDAKTAIANLESDIADAVKAAESNAGTVADLRTQLEAAEKLATDNEKLYNASVAAANALQVQYNEKVKELGDANFRNILIEGSIEVMNEQCEMLYQETLTNAKTIENLEKRIVVLETELDKTSGELGDTSAELEFLQLMYGAMNEEREGLIATNDAYAARIAELQTTVKETEELLNDSRGSAELFKALHEASLSEVTRLTAEKNNLEIKIEGVEKAIADAEVALGIKDSEIEFLNEVHAISMQEAKRMENEISTLTGSNTTLLSTIGDLESKLSAAEENYAQEQRENDELNNQVNDLRKALNDKTDEANGLIEDLSDTKKEIATLTGRLTAAEKNQELTDAELEATNAALTTAESRISDLENELAVSKSTLDSKDAELGAANTRNNNLEIEIGYAQGEIRALKVLLGDAKSEASVLGGKINGLNNQIIEIRNDATSTAAEKDAQIGQLSEELATALSDYREATGEISELNDRIAGLNNQVATLDEEKAALNATIVGLQNEKTAYIDDVKRLTGELGDADIEIADLEGMLDNANKEIEELKAALKAEIGKVEALQASAATAATEIADLRSQVEEKIAEKTGLQTQLDEATVSYDAAIAEMAVVKADLAEALADLKEEQDRYTVSESENTELEARIVELELELENAKATIENNKNVGPVNVDPVNAESEEDTTASDAEAQAPYTETPVRVVVGSETVDAVVGQKMVVKADEARDGYEFNGWVVDGKIVSTDATLTMVITSDVNIQQYWTAVGSAAEDVEDVATGSELGGLEAGSGDLIKCLAVLLLVVGGLFVVKRELA